MKNLKDMKLSKKLTVGVITFLILIASELGIEISQPVIDSITQLAIVYLCGQSAVDIGLIAKNKKNG